MKNKVLSPLFAIRSPIGYGIFFLGLWFFTLLALWWWCKFMCRWYPNDRWCKECSEFWRWRGWGWGWGSGL